MPHIWTDPKVSKIKLKFNKHENFKIKLIDNIDYYFNYICTSIKKLNCGAATMNLHFSLVDQKAAFSLQFWVKLFNLWSKRQIQTQI